MSISVCMATYNGEKYLVHQLRSIVEQLADDDEVIIVDDCSTDGTVAIIRQFCDHRITVYVNEQNQGEVFSFSQAILRATKDFVYLSDQDDIWIPGRASLMQQCLIESGASVVTTNFEWIDANEAPINVTYDGVTARDSKKYLKNIIDIFLGKTNYFGCAMAFRRMFVNVVAPIPSFVESHDLWIALASNVARSNVHLNERTLLKRKHMNNATSTISTRSLYRKLKSRVIFATSLLVLFWRQDCPFNQRLSKP